MLKKTFEGADWQWLVLDPESGQDDFPFAALPETCRDWIHSLQKRNSINLEMDTTVQGKESVWGGIIYHQDVEDHETNEVAHYYVSEDLLITTDIDASLLHTVSQSGLLKKLEAAENAVDGFMIVIGEVVTAFLHDIDAFEQRMHGLLWRIKEKNDEKVFNQLMKNRHEILIWKNLLIPIVEIQEAMEEAFGEKIAGGIHYGRTKRRIRRCRNIIREYNEEIGEMIDLETVISSQRGNEIVKTLTVITLLFTPASAFGAIWGMNFARMPELEWRFGYLIALLLIGATTWGFYYFLKKKNWMGSLIRTIKE